MVRVWKKGVRRPKPYGFNIACCWRNHETVEVIGTNDRTSLPPTPEEFGALLKTLGEFGVKTVFYTRYDEDGQERIYRHKTR